MGDEVPSTNTDYGYGLRMTHHGSRHHGIRIGYREADTPMDYLQDLQLAVIDGDANRAKWRTAGRASGRGRRAGALRKRPSSGAWAIVGEKMKRPGVLRPRGPGGRPRHALVAGRPQAACWPPAALELWYNAYNGSARHGHDAGTLPGRSLWDIARELGVGIRALGEVVKRETDGFETRVTTRATRRSPSTLRRWARSPSAPSTTSSCAPPA